MQLSYRIGQKRRLSYRVGKPLSYRIGKPVLHRRKALSYRIGQKKRGAAFQERAERNRYLTY
jgi:hypothetical protein